MLQPHAAAKVTVTFCWCPRGTKSSGTPGLWEDGEKEPFSSKLGEGGEERQPLCRGCGNCSKTFAESANKPLQLLPCGGKHCVGSRPPQRDPGPERCSPFPAGRSKAQTSTLDRNPQGGFAPAYSSVPELENIAGMKM